MPKPAEPEGNIGVYKRLTDVPSHYRLSNFEAGYEPRDVWAEFTEATYPDPSDRLSKCLRRFRDSWKAFMEERGRHHALAQPGDVEAYCSDRLEDIAMRTMYSNYWVYLEAFYSWLQESTEHPHVYHPPIMAAVEYPNAREVWDFRIERALNQDR